MVADAVEFLIDLLEGNLVLCVQHVLIPFLAELFLMVITVVSELVTKLKNHCTDKKERLTLSCSANSIQARQLLAVAIYRFSDLREVK